MKSDKDGNVVTTHCSPYEYIWDDFSHEALILDNVTGVFNVGSPSVIRIGYGKKSKNKNLRMMRIVKLFMVSMVFVQVLRGGLIQYRM